jgi:hypothetical protein
VAIPHYAPIANIVQIAVHNRIHEDYCAWEDHRYRPGDVAIGGASPFFPSCFVGALLKFDEFAVLPFYREYCVVIVTGEYADGILSDIYGLVINVSFLVQVTIIRTLNMSVLVAFCPFCWGRLFYPFLQTVPSDNASARCRWL